jgi:hypothetical protein
VIVMLTKEVENGKVRELIFIGTSLVLTDEICSRRSSATDTGPKRTHSPSTASL